ncbi:pyridoxal phosphate-dependent decarboxylase family protein [Polyangium aurulentum]|uniref:pyridoxal phosphate-dependent decarboxylase family protein n=1 Tax=Polyangium aurulentum TaxID=2567896 RepID=UPI0010AE5B07|nr:pyridoxal-dependent decarboxylase [Polyangium aurulentum]UQA56695.1 aspartate aminotransferase family protein [Polyangium aurulentum]
MDENLKADLHGLEALLERAKNEAHAFLNRLDELPPAVNATPKEALSLPEQGLGAEPSLRLFMDRYGQELGGSAGPRYLGFVTGGTTPAALVGDWMASAFDLNASHPGSSAAPLVEQEALEMLRQLLALPKTFSGSFVSGATMSNFVGLACARQWVARKLGVDVAEQGLYALGPIPTLSATPHSSTLKALSMLGMGRGSLVRVPSQPGREAMDVDALRAQLESLGGKPCIVVASAGTVNTGDYDDLEAIGKLKERHPFWLHVDGAFGGLVACSPELAHLTRGMELSDSVTVDAHKWLNVPYDSALQLTRHPELLLEVFRNHAPYLDVRQGPAPFADQGPENSRRFRALPAWLTLMAYGRSGYRDILERDCRLARMLGERIEGSTAFERLAPVRLNIVCFTLRQEGGATQADIRAFLDRLRDDGRVFVSPTVLHGVPGMRAALSNWRTTERDIEIAWSAMLEVATRAAPVG